jgi:hypothetical protein
MPQNAMKWQVGDCVKCLEDGVVGTVIDADYSRVVVRWDDGAVSSIGRGDAIANGFERVC